MEIFLLHKTRLNHYLTLKARIISIKSTVPADNSDQLLNYPDGVTLYSSFLGAKVLLPGGSFQNLPIPGIFFYSQPSYFQIHCYGIDSQYVGKDIWLYFGIPN